MYTPIEEIYKVADYLTESEKTVVLQAYNVALKSHAGQLRKSGEPYFNHCVATAINIAEQKMDYETIAAGLMHDVLEDTSYTHDQMVVNFGEDITKLVEGVTKLGHVKYTGAERHVESLRKFFIAMSDDMRVVVIKLCDRLHNIRTLQYVPKDKQRRIALETIEIHARLADRLGMGRLKAELEDTAFLYVYPDEYAKTMRILSDIKSADEDTLTEVADTIRDELKILEVNIERVDSRIKHLYSLWSKLKKHNYDISKVYDIIALRIIVPELSDCYQALGVIHGLYKPVPSRFKDYIASPKPNGYQSLHTAIFTGDGAIVEVQIRTKQMHEEAEYGIASHLSYKEKHDKHASGKLAKKTLWTKDLIEWQKDMTPGGKKSKTFMDNLKADFFNARVFAFTPKGDVLDLPEGSTPLDFAYSVHSDIGDHAVRSYANEKLVPFNYTIKNHDVIRIETSDSAKPNRKWLDISKSTIAKRHIRVWLKEHGGILDRFLVK